MDIQLILGNLLTPPVLFFFLGMAATLLRSDLEIPQAVTRGLSLYLLFAIGMHGGRDRESLRLCLANHQSPSRDAGLGGPAAGDQAWTRTRLRGELGYAQGNPRAMGRLLRGLALGCGLGGKQRLSVAVESPACEEKQRYGDH